ncbi:MAG: uroporphyrinogen-III synthase [Propionicimonas sp.]
MPDRPLARRRILLPGRSSDVMRAALVDAGAEVDEVQLLDRRPLANPALEGLPERILAGEVDWLVITSAFATVALRELGHPLGVLCPAGLALAAVGPTSAAAVLGETGRVPLQPTHGTGGAALAATLPGGPGLVVVPGAWHPAPALRTALIGKGWKVEEIGIYQTLPVAPSSIDAALRQDWQTGRYDALVVTATSVASAAATLLGVTGPVVAIGEASARAAAQAGFPRVATAPSAAASDLVATLAGLLN